MSDPRINAVARDISRELLEHWIQYKEPFPLSLLGQQHAVRLKRCLGFEATTGWFCKIMHDNGVFKILRTRAGKKWLMLADIWNGLEPAEQARINVWLQTAVCPRWELRRQRLKNQQTG